jgi:hypothetical protein
MRLWSLHPKYLDTKGLLALWREGLLAYHVLQGKTKGYRNHPQLNRFKEAENPVAVIEFYLTKVAEEAASRGYNFDRSKVPAANCGIQLNVTTGQLAYEFSHLRNKLQLRDPDRLVDFEMTVLPDVHPLFRIVEGEVAEWERR